MQGGNPPPKTTDTGQPDQAAAKPHRACPPWVGYLLLCPLRKFGENPRKILAPHVRPGMTVLEPGCAMGFFSLPLARMVGPEGRVICVDLQEAMIRRLERRARKVGLSDRIETHVCSTDDLGLDAWSGRIDLIAAIHMIHEVEDAQALLSQFYDLLRLGGRLLVVEPKGHVGREQFEGELEQARSAGFGELEAPRHRRELAALLEKP